MLHLERKMNTYLPRRQHTRPGGKEKPWVLQGCPWVVFMYCDRRFGSKGIQGSETLHGPQWELHSHFWIHWLNHYHLPSLLHLAMALSKYSTLELLPASHMRTGSVCLELHREMVKKPWDYTTFSPQNLSHCSRLQYTCYLLIQIWYFSA